MSYMTHLHGHSDFSEKDATSRPHDMAKRLHAIDQTAIALTDHGSLAGIAIFDKELKKQNLKLIAGWEAYVALKGADDTTARDTAHLTLLAMNMEGYHNLLKLHSLSWQRPAYYFNPRTDFDLLGDHSEGVIALSGCLGGVLLKPLHAGDTSRADRNLKALKQIFGKRLYVEIQDHQLDEDAVSIDWLLEQAEKYKLPVVATNDYHYVNKEDWNAHDRIIACGKGQKVKDPARQIVYKPEEFYIKSYAEMAERFDKAELAMSKTISDLCEPLKLESKVFHLPVVDKKGLPALRVLAEKGIVARFGKPLAKLPKTYQERFDYELKAIDKGGFTQYLLLMHDMYAFMDEEGIPYGPGRGSAAASLVCYALRITGVDPIEYDLLFERFINPERVSAPDVDIDVSADRRNELITYLRDRWGEENVAQIITFGTLGAPAAIRDMARTLGKPLALADKLAKLVPKNGSLTTDREDRHYIDETLKTVKEFKKLYDTDKDAKEIIDAARDVEGIIKNSSVHAAGVVIADKPLVNYAPLITTKEKEDSKDRVVSVAYAMNELEGIGLIKFDLLGLSTLDVIDDTVRTLIRERLLPKEFSIDSIPLDDPKTFSLLGLGLTQGVFQFECVAGDTILNGDPRKTIADCYLNPPKRMTSVDLGAGKRRANNVLKVIQSGEKQLYRLNTEHNYTLRATRDHKILTERGWLKLGDIQINDRIVVNRKDASRIGACKDCGEQIKSRAERCHSCANIIRDSGKTMSDNRKWNCPTLPDNFEFERVTSILKDKVEMTYDVAMESPLNNYIANGIVVHNSAGMAGWLRKLKPDHINDLIAMVALYRPGPMADIPKYVDGKLGIIEVEYPHPKLKATLSTTYGVAVYQEQLMKIGQVIAGWSLARADQLRKVIGKKIIDKIAEERKQFADDAKKNGYDWDWADDLFERVIEPAARYSFNKGHATVYGLLAYRTAYLKANFPLQYISALLANLARSTKASKTDKTTAYIADARALGIAVLPPDIHESGLDFTPIAEKKAIRYGLLAIKNVGDKAIQVMVKERDKHGPFTDLFDFVARTRNRLISTRTIESLIFAGALDSLPGDRLTKAASVEAACDRADKIAEDRERVTSGGKAVNRKKPIPECVLVNWTGEDINLLSRERELLGTYISGHPFNDVANEAASVSSVDLQGLRDLGPDSSATICGIVTTVNKIVTKKKMKMCTLVIEDTSCSQEILVFPKKNSEYGDFEQWLDKPIVIFGRLEDGDDDNANPKFILDRCYNLDSAPTRRKSTRTSEPTTTVNRYHLTPENYTQMIAQATAPCSFILPDGTELICSP